MVKTLGNARKSLIELAIAAAATSAGLAGCVYSPPDLDSDQKYMQIMERARFNDAERRLVPIINERNINLLGKFQEYFIKEENRGELEEKLSVEPEFGHERGGYWLFKDGTFIFNELENEGWIEAAGYVERIKKRDLSSLDELLRTIDTRIEMEHGNDFLNYYNGLRERCASLRTDKVLLENEKRRDQLLDEYLRNVAGLSYNNQERSKHISNNPESIFATCHFHHNSPASWKDIALSNVLCPEVVLMFDGGKIVGVQYLGEGEVTQIWPVKSQEESK